MKAYTHSEIEGEIILLVISIRVVSGLYFLQFHNSSISLCTRYVCLVTTTTTTNYYSTLSVQVLVESVILDTTTTSSSTR